MYDLFVIIMIQYIDNNVYNIIEYYGYFHINMNAHTGVNYIILHYFNKLYLNKAY